MKEIINLAGAIIYMPLAIWRKLFTGYYKLKTYTHERKKFKST